MSSTWKCPRCETLNEDSSCFVCGFTRIEAEKMTKRTTDTGTRRTRDPGIDRTTRASDLHTEIKYKTDKHGEVKYKEKEKSEPDRSLYIAAWCLTLATYISVFTPNWITTSGRYVSISDLLSGTERSLTMNDTEIFLTLIVLVVSILPVVVGNDFILKKYKFSMISMFLGFLITTCYSVGILAVVCSSAANVAIIPIGFLFVGPIVWAVQYLLFWKHWSFYWK